MSDSFRYQQHSCLSSHTECPSMVETTALGAAIAAGLATGVWSDLSTLPDPTLTSYQPSIGHDGLCVPILCYTVTVIIQNVTNVSLVGRRQFSVPDTGTKQELPKNHQ